MRKTSLAVALILALSGPATAQTVTDGSDAALAPQIARTVLALVRDGIRDGASAHLSALRLGKAGAVCGEIDRQNRMGAYTGARRFVADTNAGFAGVLPDAPELRAPGSMAAYRDMQRTLDLLKANCSD